MNVQDGESARRDDALDLGRVFTKQAIFSRSARIATVR